MPFCSLPFLGSLPRLLITCGPPGQQRVGPAAQKIRRKQSLSVRPRESGDPAHSASKTRVNALMALDSRFRGDERSLLRWLDPPTGTRDSKSAFTRVCDALCLAGARERSEETQAPRHTPPEPGGAGIWARTRPLDSFDGLARVLQ